MKKQENNINEILINCIEKELVLIDLLVNR